MSRKEKNAHFHLAGFIKRSGGRVEDKGTHVNPTSAHRSFEDIRSYTVS